MPGHRFEFPAIRSTEANRHGNADDRPPLTKGRLSTDFRVGEDGPVDVRNCRRSDWRRRDVGPHNAIRREQEQPDLCTHLDTRPGILQN